MIDTAWNCCADGAFFGSDIGLGPNNPRNVQLEDFATTIPSLAAQKNFRSVEPSVLGPIAVLRILKRDCSDWGARAIERWDESSRLKELRSGEGSKDRGRTAILCSDCSTDLITSRHSLFEPQPRSELKKAAGSSPFSMTSTSADPTMTPSTCGARRATCSWLRIPKPAQTGNFDTALTRAK